jgi:hypothetical protein
MTGDAGSVLAIGAILGDSDMENMAWSRAIGALSQRVEKLSLGLTSPLRVNVVFHVDGRLAPNEFVGVRTGRFNKGKSQLVVQAAVPPGPAEDRHTVLLRLLADAVNEAETFARKGRIADGLDEIRALIESLPAG